MNAAPTPVAMSVNMLRFHVFSETQAFVKNIPPAQKTTGIVRMNSIHFVMSFRKWMPGTMWDIARTNTGRVSAAAIQNLRVRSRIS